MPGRAEFRSSLCRIYVYWVFLRLNLDPLFLNYRKDAIAACLTKNVFLGYQQQRLPMTPYHAKYYAHELSRTGGEGVDRFHKAMWDVADV